MSAANPIDSPKSLRDHHYNATVLDVRLAANGLMILRVVYDEIERPEIEPGQYLVLGLGNWEDRADDILAVDPRRTPKVVQRAYSVSCSLLDRNRIIGLNDEQYVEFCIRLVERHSDKPAMLTPRLFSLHTGDRLFMGERPHGSYSLDPVADADTVLLLGTGTGEAPHNTMVAELLKRGHKGTVICATSVRYDADLAYINEHRQLEQRFDNYRYVALTTREPRNVDPTVAGFVGKQHLQDWITSATFESEFGSLDPRSTHVFLCGSPLMIGMPTHVPGGEVVFPETVGMIEVLTDLGFQLNRPRQPGNIHVEKFW